MNRVLIIGNITKNPESRVTQSGINVCSFTVAVNRRHREGQQDQADFFRVTAWRQLGENCQKYLTKGKKVAVVGSVSVSTYQGRDGKTYATLDVTAEDVEFLSPKVEEQKQGQQMSAGYEEVTGDDLPF